MKERPNALMRFLHALLRIYRGLRSVILNLLFILLLLLLISPFLPQPQLPVQSDSALVLNPQGILVEQYSLPTPSEELRYGLSGLDDRGEVLVQDLLDAISQAAGDPRINSMVILTDDFLGGGFSQLRDVAAALQSFRDTGKTIYAWGSGFNQAQYYLASQAHQVLLNPLGAVELEGFGAWQLYYNDALDRLGVNAHIFRVGEYKAAVEPFERNNMSPEARENYQQFLGDLWSLYTADIAARRQLEPAGINDYSNRLNEYLAEQDGDSALTAQAVGLVDQVSARTDAFAYLQAEIGADGDSFRGIAYRDYLRRNTLIDTSPEQNRIGLIVASGEIRDGEAAPGSVGGETLSALVRQARQDDRIRALVLRVDSPGGSMAASELIRDELEAFRESGRPLVVSMGNVAASGGYWISTPANQIWASAATITGSIGIYGVLPTFEQSLEKLGLNVDGVGTTALSGAGAIGRPLNTVVAESLQLTVENGYRRFLSLVAEARDMSTEEVDQIAQGRVWSGQRAHELGLVDELGSLDAAVAAAADLAGIESYQLQRLENELSPLQQALRRLLYSDSVQALLKLESQGALLNAPQAGSRLWNELARRLTLVLKQSAAKGPYVHCLECEFLQF